MRMRWCNARNGERFGSMKSARYTGHFAAEADDGERPEANSEHAILTMTRYPYVGIEMDLVAAL